VTLLDHLVNQLGAHASPTLFGRLCRKVQEMKLYTQSNSKKRHSFRIHFDSRLT
jgi:hypothetical protein